MNAAQQTPLEASRPLGVAQDLAATVLGQHEGRAPVTRHAAQRG